jgi:hypothetical protein
MLAHSAHLSDSEEDTPIDEMRVTFVRVQDALETDLFFAKIRTHGLMRPLGERQVTGKMRGKLLSWLEKLALGTFHFARGTYITAVLILDQFLMQFDESPSKLQLLGCASLLVASKLTEEVIVAPECFLAACCSIFRREQLL